MANHTSGRREGERGGALVATLLVLVLMLTVGTAALLNSTFDLKSTTHYYTGTQAFYAAESGLLHALNAINRAGVSDFQRDVVNQWSALLTPNPQSLPGYDTYTYQVGLTADPARPATRGTIRAVGLAPSNARRVIRAIVEKAPTYKGRGAIYLAADAVNTQFSGNGFDVDGNDHDRFGALVPGGVVEAGLATRSDAVRSSVVQSLNTQQKDNVRGLGFSTVPLTPSVIPTGGPSVSDLDNIIADILSNPNVVVDNSSNVNANTTFGTVEHPQITHLTAASFKVTANGNASGAGILIVDGSITINGNFDFIGWILVRGETIINDSTSVSGETTALGNANILGSLWTGDLVVKVGGSAIINFCEFCLSLADQVPDASQGYIPKTMRIVSWEEEL